MKKISIITLVMIFSAIFLGAKPTTPEDADFPVNPPMWFDVEYYAQNNPDVVEVFCTEESLASYDGIDNALWVHYCTHGYEENRQPCETEDWFDPEYYAKTYPEVAEIYGEDDYVLFVYYYKYGRQNGDLPSEGYEHTYFKDCEKPENNAVIIDNGMAIYPGATFYVCINTKHNVCNFYINNRDGDGKTIVRSVRYDMHTGFDKETRQWIRDVVPGGTKVTVIN